MKKRNLKLHQKLLPIAVSTAIASFVTTSTNAFAAPVELSFAGLTSQNIYPNQNSDTTKAATGLLITDEGNFTTNKIVPLQVDFSTVISVVGSPDTSKVMGINIQQSNVNLTNDADIKITNTLAQETYGIFSDRLVNTVNGVNVYKLTNVNVTNNGNIEIINNTVAAKKRTAAIQFKEELGQFSLINNGKMYAEGLSTNNGTVGSYFLSNVEGLYTDDNLDSLKLVNNEKGEITAKYSDGAYGIAVYNRAPDFEFINYGTINGKVLLRGICETTECDVQTFINHKATNGDLYVYTASSGTYSSADTNSKVTFSPVINSHVNPSEVGDKSHPLTNLGYIGGQLRVVDLASTINGTTSGAGVATGLSIDASLLETGGQTLTVKPIIGDDAHVKNGQYYKIANSYFSVNPLLPNFFKTSSDNKLVSWTPEINSDNILVLKAEVSPSKVTGLSEHAHGALSALMESENELTGKIQNLPDEASVSKASEQIRPEVNGANIEAVLGVTDRVFNLVANRLSDTHLAAITGKTGIATGEQANGVGVWFEGIGVNGTQDRRNNVDGYHADAYGFALGADKALDNDVRVGAALSYANSRIKADGVNLGNNTDIDTYQATVYGSKLMGSWYLNGTLGLGLHQYESNRLVLTNNVKGSHDAWQYSAKVDAGYPLQVGTATLTPVASFTYSHLNQDSYAESGVGALNIASNDVDSFKSGLGAKAMIPLSTAGGFKTAFLGRAIYNHEFGDVQQDTTANFVGSNTTFTTNGVNVARDGLNLGASLVLSHNDKNVVQNLSISYDADIKDQYLSHTARLQARFDF